MKSLFALGAWSIAMLSFTGAALGQYANPPAASNPYWATTEGAVGSGVAPSIVRPPQNSYTPPAQSRPAPYTAPPFGQVNYQRDGALPNGSRELPAPDIAPPRPAPPIPAPAPSRLGPPNIGQPNNGQRSNLGPSQYRPTQIGPGQFGPSQGLGVSPAQGGDFTLDAGAYCAPSKHIRGGWFGGVGGLFLDRDNGNSVWLSVDDVDITDRVITTRDAEMDVAGGVELSIGRYFKNNCHAWQLTYWGVFPSDEDVYAYNGVDTVGQLASSRTFDGLDYNGGQVANFYNVADAHWLRREYQFHNVEWNIMGSPCITGCGGKGEALFGECGAKCGSCSKRGAGCSSCGGGGCSSCYGVAQSAMRWNWLAGFRYFQFGEGMTYATDAADTVFNGAADEVYYEIDIENHLFGFQVGGIADYCLTSRWNWRNAVKVGVYASHITHYSRIGGSAGTATVNNINSPYDGDDWLINSTKNDVAMMGEWDTGLSYQCSCNWRARFGYRVVAVTGVAFAANQIPTATFTDLNDVAIIDSNGSLLLHGGYASLEYSY